MSEALFHSEPVSRTFPMIARVLLVLGIDCVVCPCEGLQVREGLRQGEGGSVPVRVDPVEYDSVRPVQPPTRAGLMAKPAVLHRFEAPWKDAAI